jgi:hypothetical protein
MDFLMQKLTLFGPNLLLNLKTKTGIRDEAKFD